MSIKVKDSEGHKHSFMERADEDYQYRFFSEGCLTRIYLYNTKTMRSERTVASFVNAIYVMED